MPAEGLQPLYYDPTNRRVVRLRRGILVDSTNVNAPPIGDIGDPDTRELLERIAATLDEMLVAIQALKDPGSST